MLQRQATSYRAMAARINYLGQDRSDIRFMAKEICRRMAKPRVKDLEALVRLAKY